MGAKKGVRLFLFALVLGFYRALCCEAFGTASSGARSMFPIGYWQIYEINLVFKWR
jgi:hypothetical protein